MAYHVTYEPINRIAGVEPKTVIFETAAEAWKAVDGLMRSDERVTIKENGLPIGWEQLRDLAAKD
jgi:hypothetical protein